MSSFNLTLKSASRSEEPGVDSGSAEASNRADVFHVLTQLRSSEHLVSNLEKEEHICVFLLHIL